METYDIITVGGGLGGASLAKAMAEHGAKVLVLEQEERFRDRVRGENLWCWGVVELQALGVYERLRSTCAWDIAWFHITVHPVLKASRDVSATSLEQVPGLNFYHPAMQEVLLQAAGEAGAEVRRGVRACGITPGALPCVTIAHDGRTEELHARVVVCADGRTSLARKWVGFPVHRDHKGMMLTGVLLDEMSGPAVDTNYLIFNPHEAKAVFLGPLGDGRVRAYLIYPKGCHATPLTSCHREGEKVLMRQGFDAVMRVPSDSMCRAVA